ncbi:hypothetical protein HDV03_002036 [Kappamyces sp. JEL0829]|nr:hypothetical protein HDV03_002036 [Kappamyces sp. JEL0829]
MSMFDGLDSAVSPMPHGGAGDAEATAKGTSAPGSVREKEKSLSVGGSRSANESMLMQRVTTIKRNQGKRSKDVNEKKEERARRLFEYIEECDRLDKEEKRASLEKRVVKQKKDLDARTELLEEKRAQALKAVAEAKRDRWTKRREMLVRIGREPEAADRPPHGAQQSNGAGHESMPHHVFISPFYQQQADLVKQARTKIQTEKEACRNKRSMLFETFSAQRHDQNHASNGARVLDSTKPKQAVVKENRAEELEKIIERYTRPDTPIDKRQGAKIEAVDTVKISRLEYTRSMVETIVKNKAKTQKATSGHVNQFGAISMISQDFALAQRHARYTADPVWNALDEAQSIEQDPFQYRDPIEFALRERRETALASAAHGESDPNPSPDAAARLFAADMAEFNMDELRDDKPKTKEGEKLVASRTEAEEKVIHNLNGMLAKSSRKGRYQHDLLKVPGEPVQPRRELRREIEDFSREELRDESDVEAQEESELDDDERDDGALPNIIVDGTGAATLAGKASRGLMVKKDSFNRASNVAVSVGKIKKRPPSIVTSMTVSKPELLRSAHPERFHSEAPDSIMPKITSKVPITQISLPEALVVPPLADWHQKVVEGLKIPLHNRSWNEISLEAVAEFGRTKYPGKSQRLANAAENDAKVSRSSRPKYHMKKLEPFSVVNSKDIQVSLQPSEKAKIDFFEATPLGSGPSFKFWNPQHDVEAEI